MVTVIYLQPLNGTWHATTVHTDSRRNSETLRLFGTLTLPTPYTAAVEGADVGGEIQRRNPEASIVILPEAR